MKTVGIRALKNRLSGLLRDVKSGEAVMVTDRGEVIAEISQPGRALHDSRVPAGVIALAKRYPPTLATQEADVDVYETFPPIQGYSSTTLLDQERGSR